MSKPKKVIAEDSRFIKAASKNPAIAKHYCNPGDLIAMLASLKSYHKTTGRKVIFAQQLNVAANYYQGAVHGTTSDNDSQKMVCMNQSMYDLIRPLVLSQDYIEDMQVYEGQTPLTIDLDVIREKTFVNLPNGSIQSWPMFAYPDLAWDLSKAWIELPNKKLPIIDFIKDKVIVNFTERYRNGNINYYFLRKFKHKLIFAGTEKEYLLFTNMWELDIPKLQVKSFLELAYAIKHCKFLLCNQSMCWNIAEAMKSPRVLEVCRYAVNCMPFYGEKSYGFLNQEGVEHYVDILMS